jgi:hypothetical protein
MASGSAPSAGKEGGVHRRKKAVLAGVAVLSAIGLALPGTAAARSFTPPLGVQDTSMIIVVDTSTGTSGINVVSWGDVSWGDASMVE